MLEILPCFDLGPPPPPSQASGSKTPHSPSSRVHVHLRRPQRRLNRLHIHLFPGRPCVRPVLTRAILTGGAIIGAALIGVVHRGTIHLREQLMYCIRVLDYKAQNV